MMVVILTDRLDLVLQTPAEVLAWVASLPAAVQAEISADRLAQIHATTPGDWWRLSFTIRERSRSETNGNCAFKGPPDPAGIVEVAYGIDESYRCQGYATETLHALTAFAFASGLVRTIRAQTKLDNPASDRVLRKCGYQPVGEVVDPEDGLVCRWEKI